MKDGEITNSLFSFLLPPNYSFSQNYRRPQLSHDGGVALINHNSIH